MPWLVRDDKVLGSLEVADGPRARAKGLLGRDDFDGALLLPHTRSVHTFGMRFSIDVAFLDPDHVILRTVQLRPNRATRVVRRARYVLEAESGSFRDWELRVGDRLEIR